MILVALPCKDGQSNYTSTQGQQQQHDEDGVVDLVRYERRAGTSQQGNLFGRPVDKDDDNFVLKELVEYVLL